MKNLFLLLIVSVISFSAFSKAIDIDDCETVAIKFLFERSQGDIDIKSIVVDNSYTYFEDEIAIYHVYNFKNNGFVIVSADDCVFPILGYSFNSSCLNKDISPEFSFWMKSYVDQIIDVKNKKAEASEKIINEWSRLNNSLPNELSNKTFRTVSPLLTTEWNQNTYYNELCPYDEAGPGDHAYAGCVPTALGQIMNYYRHPLQGGGSYSYTDENYGFLSVDFSQQTYNWDAMATELFDSNYEIAKLLYNIGVSVDMNYGPNGSGMTNHKGAYTLKTYFDYVNETQYYFRDSIDIAWVDTLIKHLDNNI